MFSLFTVHCFTCVAIRMIQCCINVQCKVFSDIGGKVYIDFHMCIALVLSETRVKRLAIENAIE